MVYLMLSKHSLRLTTLYVTIVLVTVSMYFISTYTRVDTVTLAPSTPNGATDSLYPSYTKEHAPYEFGIVLVEYDEDTFSEEAVIEYFSARGINANVTQTFTSAPVKVIDLGEDIDPLPVTRQLTTVPGVVSVQPNWRAVTPQSQ